MHELTGKTVIRVKDNSTLDNDSFEVECEDGTRYEIFSRGHTEGASSLVVREIQLS